MSAHIVTSLQKRYSTAYFFCKVQTESKRLALGILRTWAWQLLQTTPDVKAKAKEVGESYEASQ